MTPARNSLKAFLKHSKSILNKTITSVDHVTYVAGNESADLDSLTAALLYGYLSASSHVADGRHGTTHISLVNIPASDMKLRPEFAALLSQASVSPEDLLTLDDLSHENSPQDIDLILVDHNAPTGLVKERYAKHLTGCIDHHEDEGVVAEDCNPRIIKKCGSCTSLIVQHLRSRWDEISSHAISSGAAHGQEDEYHGDDASLVRHWDSQVAKVGIGSILIDTHNLQDESKVTDDDRQAVKYLEAKILSAPGAADWDRATFFESLDKAKKDLGSLSVNDCLRKDYKMWTEAGANLGFSSVVKPIKWLIKKAGSPESLKSEIENFSRDRELSVFVLMTAFTDDDGSFVRELLLSASGNVEIVERANAFGREAKDELGLSQWNGNASALEEQSTDCYRQVWQQTETQHSRKVVGPLLRKAIRG